MKEAVEVFRVPPSSRPKVKDDICISLVKLTKQMRLVVKDVDTLIYAIQEKITRSIQADNDYIEATVKEAAEDIKTRFELMESKMKVTELDLNINFNLKIAKAEENLSQKIDDNSERLTNVEETLASLLKADESEARPTRPSQISLFPTFWVTRKRGKALEVSKSKKVLVVDLETKGEFRGHEEAGGSITKESSRRCELRFDKYANDERDGRIQQVV
ncbi:hypothetical protein Dimus_027212 [Dionaea muscipula]